MATAVLTTVDSVTRQRDAFMEDVLAAAGGAFKMFTMYLGEQLGYYQVLGEAGSLTPAEVAVRSGADVRYTREWLEQQTVAGILDVENPEMPAAARRYFLPKGHDEVLTDTESLNFLAPLAQLVVASISPMDEILNAYRTGGGVPFESYGKDLREGQARMNRAAFLQQLGGEWIPVMKDVYERLAAEEPARVADIGCGCGYSSIGVAQSFPNAEVDGFDLDEASIDDARENAREAGLSDRVHFHACDAAEAEAGGGYDLVMALECIHDMSDPVATLATMRKLVKPGGAVFVADERVGDTFTKEGNDVEWLMYGCSVLHCLPVGMCGHQPAGTGTVMRCGTLDAYARQAGFKRMEVLPIQNFMFRFYRLY